MGLLSGVAGGFVVCAGAMRLTMCECCPWHVCRVTRILDCAVSDQQHMFVFIFTPIHQVHHSPAYMQRKTLKKGLEIARNSRCYR